MKSFKLFLVFGLLISSLTAQERELIFQSDSISIYESEVSKTSKDNLFPVLYNNGLIYNTVDKNDYYNPHYIDSTLKKHKIKIGLKYRLGGLSIFKNTIFFTGISRKADNYYDYNLTVYKGILEKNKVSKIRKLKICDPNSTYAHPAVSPDGSKLVVVTNEKNRFHLLELTKDDKGDWTQKELVYIIHPSFDIINPTYFGENTIYFSSNYYDGSVTGLKFDIIRGKVDHEVRDMETGSFNIYKVERFNEQWGIPVKVPSLNSESDDLGALFITEKTGYITSYRYSNTDNIYYFELK